VAGFSKTQLLLTFLNIFRDRIISSGVWPAHSYLVLILVILFFLSCLKDKGYNTNPQMKELKENIDKEIANISAEQLQRVNQNLFHQCKEYVHVGGPHFQHSYAPCSKQCTGPREAQSHGTGKQSENPSCTY
jgi:hypothetical protein